MFLTHFQKEETDEESKLVENQVKIDSPLHPDLDTALGVPCDEVVAGDQLVRPVHQAARVLLHYHARLTSEKITFVTFSTQSHSPIVHES